MPNRIAFIGLGVMGYPMAGHLAHSGHHMVVFNRTRAKAERWVSEFGGRTALTPAAAAVGPVPGSGLRPSLPVRSLPHA